MYVKFLLLGRDRNSNACGLSDLCWLIRLHAWLQTTSTIPFSRFCHTVQMNSRTLLALSVYEMLLMMHAPFPPQLKQGKTESHDSMLCSIKLWNLSYPSLVISSLSSHLYSGGNDVCTTSPVIAEGSDQSFKSWLELSTSSKCFLLGKEKIAQKPPIVPEVRSSFFRSNRDRE